MSFVERTNSKAWICTNFAQHIFFIKLKQIYTDDRIFSRLGGGFTVWVLSCFRIQIAKIKSNKKSTDLLGRLTTGALGHLKLNRNKNVNIQNKSKNKKGKWRGTWCQQSGHCGRQHIGHGDVRLLHQRVDALLESRPWTEALTSSSRGSDSLLCVDDCPP